MPSIVEKEPGQRARQRVNGGQSGVIVTAGSRGGIDALKILLSSLPKDFSRPIVVVQHRTAHRPFFLPQILGRVSSLPVRFADNDERLEPGTVYLVPHGFHASFERGRQLRLFNGTRIKYVLSSANPLFESAARELGPGVIAVVLSGAGTDGTDGVQAVKAGGGMVIVQDRATSAAHDMPRAAIATGAVDYVLPVEEIGPLLAKLTRNQDDQ